MPRLLTTSSSLHWLDRYVHTLLVSAADDPFLPREVLEEVRAADGSNPALHCEFPEHGGHVGFIAGSLPGSYVLSRMAGDRLLSAPFSAERAASLIETRRPERMIH